MTLAVVLPTFLNLQAGDSDGYMTLGLLFLPSSCCSACRHFCGRASVHPPVIHAERNPSSPSSPAQEPPVPRPAAVFVVNARRLGAPVTVMLFYASMC